MTEAPAWIDVEREKAIWMCGARGIDLLVLLALNTFANRHDVARPSIATLAGRAGVTYETAQTALVRLEQRGLVRIERRDRRPALVVLTLPSTPEIGGSSADATTPEIRISYPRNRGQTTPEIGGGTNKPGTKGGSNRKDEPRDSWSGYRQFSAEWDE